MIKTYELLDGDIEKMSIVLDPAVEVGFMCFSKDLPQKLEFNDTKRIITGVAILANTPIYRYNKTFGDHYVVFTDSLIEKLVLKFFKSTKNSEVNIEHKDNVSGITIFESYIKSDKINSNLFPDIPDGSWIVSYKVENPEIYKKIRSGNLKGFSIEGFFSYPEEAVETSIEDEFYNELKNLIK